MNVGVFIGRFNPPHIGHITNIIKVLEENDRGVIVIGSANATPSPKNFLNIHEITSIISQTIEKERPELLSKLMVCTVSDHLYSNQNWVEEVRKTVSKTTSSLGVNTLKKPNHILYGFDKDQTSQYLKWFPFWKTAELQAVTFNDNLVHATDIRNTLFELILKEVEIEEENGNDIRVDLIRLERNVKAAFAGILDTELFWHTIIRDIGFHRLKWFATEYRYYRDYKLAWKAAPFPPVFVTGDAVVFCNGCVLLVQRKKNPGKGNYALPGGFVNQDEPIQDGILRELKEETKIDVPPGKLKNSLHEIVMFDAPGRSLRGRTITHAGLIVLEEDRLPRVKGSDDAEKAFWVPLEQLKNISNQFFEDHYHIIMAMKSRLK